MEIAITVLLGDKRLVEQDGVVCFETGRESYPLASEQLKRRRALGGGGGPDEDRKRTYEVVKDVVARRSDGRPMSAEPLEDFAAQLDGLGFGRFVLWWRQTTAELRLLDTSTTPVAVAVHAAALVEGALTFVVKHARERELAVFRSNDFSGEPRTWKIDDLVKSASGGGQSEFPAGPPDLRPEEARQAKATVDAVVRRVLDWLRLLSRSAPASNAGKGQ